MANGYRRPTRQTAFPATGFEGYEAPEPEFYQGGDPHADAIMRLLRGGGPKDIPLSTPPPAPPMFRQQPPQAEQPFRSPQPPGLDASGPGLVEGPGAASRTLPWTRTPGGAGATGEQWLARQPQGVPPHIQQRMPEPAFRRPIEELYKLVAPQEGMGVAPGAQLRAGRELSERLGPSLQEQMQMQQAQIPLQQEHLRGQYGVEQEQVRGEAGLAQEQAKQEALGQGYQMLQQFLGARGEGGLEPGVSISLSGVGSYRAPAERQTSQGLLRDLTAAKTAWEDSEGFMGQRDEVLGSQYRQALGAAYGQDPSHPSTKEMALEIATDPEWSNMPLSQLLQDPRLSDAWDLSTMSDEDLEDLNRLLDYSRGAVGF